MAVDKVLLAAPRGFCAGVEMALTIAPMTMASSCCASRTQAIVCKRCALAATNGSPARTVSTIASSRLRTT